MRANVQGLEEGDSDVDIEIVDFADGNVVFVAVHLNLDCLSGCLVDLDLDCDFCTEVDVRGFMGSNPVI